LRQTLTLWGSTDALDRLMHPWRAGSRALASLPIPASFQIGQTRLPARHVRSLRVGDAVLLQDVFAVFRQNEASQAYPGIAALRMVLADTLTAMLSQTDTGWRLDTSLRHKSKEDDTLNDGTETIDGDMTASVDLDGLPVQLVFEAARLDLPLGDLRRLGAGSILELNVAPGRIRIIANGRRIGDGELVSIDGRVGVRIIAFSDEADIVPGSEAE
jgi:type III secretion protein Q